MAKGRTTVKEEEHQITMEKRGTMQGLGGTDDPHYYNVLRTRGKFKKMKGPFHLLWVFRQTG